MLAPAARQANILVILCDDIGAHEIALYGHPVHKTPVLDGMSFTPYLRGETKPKGKAKKNKKKPML